MEFDSQLGILLFDSMEDAPAVAETAIRNGHFILFQQIDADGDSEDESSEEGAVNVSVVTADVEGEMAVVCFTDEEAADHFLNEELPEDVGEEIPSLVLEGEQLLDGLPAEFGLLVNPGSELECYFAPGAFL